LTIGERFSNRKIIDRGDLFCLSLECMKLLHASEVKWNTKENYIRSPGIHTFVLKKPETGRPGPPFDESVSSPISWHSPPQTYFHVVRDAVRL
jgi:hypothetical protein